MEQEVLNKVLRRNTWWTTGKVAEARLREFRRPVFNELLESLPGRRIISLSGLRRIGKTTLMYQVADSLLKGGTKPQDILFVSFDELLTADSTTFDEIFEWYEAKILEGKKKERVYVFIDEIHFLPQWDRILKSYYENRPEIKFVISGSASIRLRKGFRESLAGRIHEILVLPFAFREIAALRGCNVPDISLDGIEETYTKMHEDDRTKYKALFERFLSYGGMPEAYLEEYDLALWQEYLEDDVVKRIVYEDMKKAYDIRRPNRLVKLLKYFAYNLSGYYEPTNIGKKLGMDRDMVEYYLNYLVQTSLVFLMPRYGKKDLKSMEKMFLGDAGIRNALLGTDADGAVIENIVFLHLLKLKPSYWKNKREVDYVIEDGERTIAIESKYANNIEEHDVEGLREYMDKHGCEKAIILTKNLLKKEETDKKAIWHIPLWLFLLMAPEKIKKI